MSSLDDDTPVDEEKSSRNVDGVVAVEVVEYSVEEMASGLGDSAEEEAPDIDLDEVGVVVDGEEFGAQIGECEALHGDGDDGEAGREEAFAT